MQLHLTPDEAETLRDFLRHRMGDLSMEISHTDNPAYRRIVRDQRDTLRRVYEALAAELAETTEGPPTTATR
jgi:hypothetical protein